MSVVSTAITTLKAIASGTSRSWTSTATPSLGRMAVTALMPTHARAQPPIAPINASSPASVSKCAMMRRRPPPSAARTVISRSRVVARASSMLATLQQAMTSSRLTAPNRV